MAIFQKNCRVCGCPSSRVICKMCESFLKEEIFFQEQKIAIDGSEHDLYYFSYYLGIVEKLLWVYKFEAEIRVSKIFSNILDEFIDFKKIDLSKTLFVPAPSSKKGFRIRGFNQIEEILFNNASIQYEYMLKINKKYKNVSQKELSRDKRLLLSREKYVIDKSFDISVLDKIDNIIIVDDVFTTGATCENAIRQIKNYCIENDFKIKISAIVFSKGGCLFGQ